MPISASLDPMNKYVQYDMCHSGFRRWNLSEQKKQSKFLGNKIKCQNFLICKYIKDNHAAAVVLLVINIVNIAKTNATCSVRIKKSLTVPLTLSTSF